MNVSEKNQTKGIKFSALAELNNTLPHCQSLAGSSWRWWFVQEQGRALPWRCAWKDELKQEKSLSSSPPPPRSTRKHFRQLHFSICLKGLVLIKQEIHIWSLKRPWPLRRDWSSPVCWWCSELQAVSSPSHWAAEHTGQRSSTYLPLRIHNILLLHIIYSPSCCTKPAWWFMCGLEWHDEFGHWNTFFC